MGGIAIRARSSTALRTMSRRRYRWSGVTCTTPNPHFSAIVEQELTFPLQSHPLQPHHLSPQHVRPPHQGDALRHAHPVPAVVVLRPRPPARSLRIQPPRPKRARHPRRRSQTSMVHHARLQRRQYQQPQRLLPASESQLRRHGLHGVSAFSPSAAAQQQLTTQPPSALFAAHLILAIWSMIPTKQQRHARNTSVESTAEMAKQSLAAGMSPEQQWEQHRWQPQHQQQQWEMQHYPRSPGSTGGLKSPMTPRSVAFHALDGNGGSGDLPLRGQPYQPYEPGR